MKIDIKDFGKRNPRYGKIMYNLWVNKEQEKLIEEAIENDEPIKILAIIDSAIKEGDFEKR